MSLSASHLQLNCKLCGYGQMRKPTRSGVGQYREYFKSTIFVMGRKSSSHGPKAKPLLSGKLSRASIHAILFRKFLPFCLYLGFLLSEIQYEAEIQFVLFSPHLPTFLLGQFLLGGFQNHNMSRY